jgi:DNA-binding CsgD family transcriptional regulator/Tfp pilus assembly protein PilF
MLREAGAGPESIAAYLLASERSGDRERVGALCAAAQTANARGAPESAAIYLARALEEPPDFVQRASLLLELAQSEAASGSPAAREHFEEALESAEDSGLRARILLGLGRLVYASGQAVEAASRFDEAARIAAQAGLHELEMELEVEYWQAATLDPSLAALTGPRVHRVVESLPEAEPSPAERAVLAAAGLDALKSGEPRAEVLNLAERAYGDGAMVDQLGSDSSALYLVTGTLHCADACERDIEILDRALADARRRGSVLAFATASYARSAPLHRVGRIDEAVADMEAALDARRYGWEQFLTYACGQLTILHIERDDLAAARDATALIDPAQWEPLPFWSQFLRGRGALALAEGRWADALADFAEWGERWPVPTPIFYARWRSPAAIAAAQLGDRDRAVALAAEELELVRPFGSARADGMALAALGLATGGDEGVVSLRAAVERLETSDSRLDLCRTLIDLGAAQRRANQRTEARASLERGLDMATRFGARRLARIAREELEVAGGRPRSPYLSGVESLTPGELRVARMAASGMTNREIAEALFVTVKAVQWHLRHVYQKLETTRAGLAAALEAGSP